MTKRRKGHIRRKRPCTLAHPTRVPDEKREEFLTVLRETRNVAFASEVCGFSRRSAYNWRNDDEEFRKEWDDALEASVDDIEQVARKIATGWDEPVFYQGEIVGHVTKYSPGLIQFLLERLRADVYRQRTDPQTVVGVNQSNSNTVEVGPKYQTFEAEPDDEYLARLVGIVDDIRERRLVAEAKKAQ